MCLQLLTVVSGSKAGAQSSHHLSLTHRLFFPQTLQPVKFSLSYFTNPVETPKKKTVPAVGTH